MDDFSDMRTFELAFALGMAETITDEEIEKIRIEREFDKEDDDFLDEWIDPSIFFPWQNRDGGGFFYESIWIDTQIHLMELQWESVYCAMISITQKVYAKNIIAGGNVVLDIGNHTLTLKHVFFALIKSTQKVCVRTITNNGEEH